MSAPRIIQCSKENFRIYNTLCKSDEDKKSKDKKEKIFATRTPAIFLAAAIGIDNNQTKQVVRERQLTRREYLIGNENYSVFEAILKSKFSITTEQEIIEKIMEFAAFGIEILYNEYHKTGEINFVEMTRDIKNRF